jgi:hypothetical protein
VKRTKRARRLVNLILTAALLAGCAAGCGGDGAAFKPADHSEAETAAGPAQASEPAPSEAAVTGTGAAGAIQLGFEPVFNKAGQAYVPVSITPSVAPYTVSPDLSNVANLGQFPNLTAEQIEKIAANGFVVAPGTQEQLFYIYEDNTYKKIPNFVTADSVLQVYHIFYDYALRSVEGQTLLPDAVTLNANMLAQLQMEYDAIADPGVRAEALKALAYFALRSWPSAKRCRPASPPRPRRSPTANTRW